MAVKFDPYAFLAKLEAQGAARAPHAIRAIPDGPSSTNSTNSTPQTEPRRTIVHQTDKPEPPVPNPQLGKETFPHGFAVNGNPRTWTGRIVSLDEWRQLSEWDRHGSTGKLWCGITRKWEPADPPKQGNLT